MPLPTVIVPGFFASTSESRSLEENCNWRGIPNVTANPHKPSLGSISDDRSTGAILHSINRAVKLALQQYNIDLALLSRPLVPVGRSPHSKMPDKA